MVNTGIKPNSATRKLPHWKTWCDFVKNGSSDHNEIYRNSAFNRANARYQLAASFDGLNLSGYADKATAGYEAVLRLMLVYTAAEALATALGVPVTDWKMDNPELAKRLRPLFQIRFVDPEGDGSVQITSRPMFASLTKTATKYLEAFTHNQNNDVRIAATTLRNLWTVPAMKGTSGL